MRDSDGLPPLAAEIERLRKQLERCEKEHQDERTALRDALRPFAEARTEPSSKDAVTLVIGVTRGDLERARACLRKG